MFQIPEDPDEFEFDFGFFGASKDEIHASKIEEFSSVEADYQKRIQKLIKAIEPFLNNLAKDSDTKEYIYWPNRKEKIAEFAMKLRKIADGR
jgi:hypothetical protein